MAEKSTSRTVTDHKTIRKWMEARGGKPATVKTTGKGEPGILRVYFPDAGPEESLEEISWEDFFEKFDQRNLAFLMQEKTADGKVSRFNKFVSREQ